MGGKHSGRRPAGQCLICNHPKNRAIDITLVKGQMKLRDIAKRFDLRDHTALQRHKKCIARRISVALEKREEKAGNRLINELERLGKICNEVIDAARKDDNNDLILRAVARLEKQLELWAKAAGEINEGVSVNVNILQDPRWVSLKAVIMDVVDEYPEVKAKLVKGISEIGG